MQPYIAQLHRDTEVIANLLGHLEGNTRIPSRRNARVIDILAHAADTIRYLDADDASLLDQTRAAVIGSSG